MPETVSHQVQSTSSSDYRQTDLVTSTVSLRVLFFYVQQVYVQTKASTRVYRILHASMMMRHHAECGMSHVTLWWGMGSGVLLLLLVNDPKVSAGLNVFADK